MNNNRFVLLFGLGFLLMEYTEGLAQLRAKPLPTPQLENTLFQYGLGPMFLGGVFREGLPVGQFKREGTFGIAAPGLVDGELIEYEGTVYQTKASGETAPAPDMLKVPFGMTCFFRPDTSYTLTGSLSLGEVQRRLEPYLSGKNGIYAIRITGRFDHLRTRAFHRVDKEPFPSITSLQVNQQVFDFSQINGTLFGFWMPPYMSGLNSTGYHFHFLADDHSKGGHLLDYTTTDVVRIELARIRTLELAIPSDQAFRRYSVKPN